jgi:hydroxymethylbilane synthase
MALMQANLIADQLTAKNPGLTVKLKIITTKGDTNDAPIPLDTIGKEWFTKEIEQALQNRSIDLAVHSLKDLAPETPEGLLVQPVLVRDDPRDALVSKIGVSLSALPKGATIGTDSLRRKALLLQHRPDVNVKSIRGNANTRLKKLEEESYDALVMAAAGLERIGKTDVITELFDPRTFTPAVGQGVLAAESREDRPEIVDMIKALQDAPTQAAVAAERAFASEIGGGCKLPIGCYVYFDGDTVHVNGMVGSMDGTRTTIKSVIGPAAESATLARQLAAQLVKEPFVAEY